MTKIFDKIYLIAFLCLACFSCGKNNPEKYILGRWEMTDIEQGPSGGWKDLMSDFIADVSYFKEITFYSDNTVYLDYLNSPKKLGTYWFNADYLEIKHAMIFDTIQPYKFNFSAWDYTIEKLTRNKLIIKTKGDPVGTDKYSDLRLSFEKTGKFE